jgi:hypothetical protein
VKVRGKNGKDRTRGGKSRYLGGGEGGVLKDRGQENNGSLGGLCGWC